MKLRADRVPLSLKVVILILRSNDKKLKWLQMKLIYFKQYVLG